MYIADTHTTTHAIETTINLVDSFSARQINIIN